MKLFLFELGKILDKFQPIWTFVAQVMIKILKASSFGQFVELLELSRLNGLFGKNALNESC